MDDGLGTLRWFGESWGAPICDPRAHVPTPIGLECSGHDHMHQGHRYPSIAAGDQGIMMPFLSENGMRTIAYHLDCWLHEVGVDRIKGD